MSVNYAEPHINDPLYKSALNFLQQGNWEKGLVQLDQLILQYPLDQKLRSLRQEMHLRAKMDRDETKDEIVERRRRLTQLAGRFWIVILISLTVLVGYSTASAFIREKVDEARVVVEQEFAILQQSTKFRDAQALLRADRPDEALVLLEEISATGADFPELQSALAEAKSASSLIDAYYTGLLKMEVQDWVAARNIFEGILEEDPTFRDVSILLANMERFTLIEEIILTSNQYYETEAWADAVAGYESVRALDGDFNQHFIEERLFSSYVYAAKSTLVDQPDSLVALEIAESYFRKALAIRPQDPEIKSERELAYLYLKSQSDYTQGLWSEVISGLEIINNEKPDYALGTARQTLYEAYIARGDAWMSNGEYEEALSDYQRGSVLAEQDPEAALRLYEAHLKIAEVEGAQGNFETAVVNYRTAIDLSDIRQRVLQNAAGQANALLKAEENAEAGNYGVAYEEYRKALGIVPGNICLSVGTHQDAVSVALARERMVKHVVQTGEYLTMLANRYRSTVCAIVVANDLEDPDVIYLGQELFVPVLP